VISNNNHHVLTMHIIKDDPFLTPSTSITQKFAIHGGNLSSTPKSTADSMEYQQILHALEEDQKKHMQNMAALLSKHERRHVANTKSIDHKLKRINDLEQQLEEQKKINEALKEEKESLVDSVSSHNWEATVDRLKRVIAALKAENESLKEVESLRSRHTGRFSQP
jgi:chromosome segregation ATPase